MLTLLPKVLGDRLRREFSMALLQLSEPGMSPMPHQRKLAVGIDLGTTHSLVAAVRSGTAEVIADHLGRNLLPSIVHYAPGQTTVGYEARKQAVSDPLNTIISVKRLMGRGVEDVATFDHKVPYQFAQHEGAGMPVIETAAGDVSPVSVSAEILKVLAARGREALGGDLDGAVITVPAYFDEAQRQATKDAAKVAGLKVLRLLNEPTAAAIAYGLDQDDEGVIAVYDLGGGTFDISILHLQAGVFEVLATGGDTALGGDDFDRAIAEWILNESQYDQVVTPHLSRELMERARDIKEQLSEQAVVTADIQQGDFRWQGKLTRTWFDELIHPLVERTLKVCKGTLRDAKVKAKDLRNVVMVGGSTRVPYVRQRVGELFDCEPKVDIDPDLVVATGAALQADVLVGNRGIDHITAGGVHDPFGLSSGARRIDERRHVLRRRLAVVQDHRPDHELFTSKEKFDARCGWPAFFDASKHENVKTLRDFSAGMIRVEVRCNVCDGHLGHVFEGEGFNTPTDQRYCINGKVLKFVPKGAGSKEEDKGDEPETGKVDKDD